MPGCQQARKSLFDSSSSSSSLVHSPAVKLEYFIGTSIPYDDMIERKAFVWDGLGGKDASKSPEEPTVDSLHSSFRVSSRESNDSLLFLFEGSLPE